MKDSNNKYYFLGSTSPVPRIPIPVPGIPVIIIPPADIPGEVLQPATFPATFPATSKPFWIDVNDSGIVEINPSTPEPVPPQEVWTPSSPSAAADQTNNNAAISEAGFNSNIILFALGGMVIASLLMQKRGKK